MPCREAVCTIFMMVFGMTRPRGKLTTYRARGGHATDWANPTAKSKGHRDGKVWNILFFSCYKGASCIINVQIVFYTQEAYWIRVEFNISLLNRFKMKLLWLVVFIISPFKETDLRIIWNNISVAILFYHCHTDSLPNNESINKIK